MTQYEAMRALIILTVAGLFLSACDAARVDDACLDPDAGMASYFPVEEGDVAQFDFEMTHRQRTGPIELENSMEGVLSWTISAIHCEGETGSISINESFEGTARTDTTYCEYCTSNGAGQDRDTSWTTTFEASFAPADLDLPGYTSRIGARWPQASNVADDDELPVAWQYASDSSDTVTVERLYHGGFGAFSSGEAHVARNRGLIEWRLSSNWREGSYVVLLKSM